MCRPGDLILIHGVKCNGETLGLHTFVVLNDEAGKVQGVDYNLICSIMSSFKNDQQRAKKLSYPGNFPISYKDEQLVIQGNERDGFIKAEQFFFFDKDNLNYRIIGCLCDDVFAVLLEFIEQLAVPIQEITDNIT